MSDPIQTVATELAERMPIPDSTNGTGETVHTFSLDSGLQSEVKPPRKRRGRKPKEAQPDGLFVPDVHPGGEDFRTMGIAVAQSFVTVCVMLGGDEWKAQESEFSALSQAWGTYFEARGIDNVPPEVMLGIVLTAYVGPRLRTQSVREKMARAWNRFRNRNQDYEKVADIHGSQSNSRFDGER